MEAGGGAYAVMRVMIGWLEGPPRPLLCGRVPNRPWASTSPSPRGWGPLP